MWLWLWLWIDCVESVDLVGKGCGHHQGENDGQELGIGHHVDVYWVYEVVG